jgi:YD repeat-containing protein
MAGTVITPFGAGTGGTGNYNVSVSQTVGSGYLTAPMVPNTQVIQTDNQAGAVQRILTYRPGGDLLQDNHVSGTLFAYSYNAAKRLVEVTQNGTDEGEYAYDFQGQRVLRWVLGSAYTAYIYDEQGHLLAEHDGHTGAASVEYADSDVIAPGIPI